MDVQHLADLMGQHHRARCVSGWAASISAESLRLRKAGDIEGCASLLPALESYYAATGAYASIVEACSSGDATDEGIAAANALAAQSVADTDVPFIPFARTA